MFVVFPVNADKDASWFDGPVVLLVGPKSPQVDYRNQLAAVKTLLVRRAESRLLPLSLSREYATRSCSMEATEMISLGPPGL